MKKIVISVCLIFVSTILVAKEQSNLAPFGITLGAKVAKGVKSKRISKNFYDAIPSKPISLFNEYSVVIDNSDFILKVIGYGKTYNIMSSFVKTT